MQVTSEVKKEIIKKFGGSEKNTGDTRCQIAMYTERINHLTEHMKLNKKDFSTQLSLMRMVGQRRRLLDYLRKHELEGYRSLIKELNIRK